MTTKIPAMTDALGNLKQRPALGRGTLIFWLVLAILYNPVTAPTRIGIIDTA